MSKTKKFIDKIVPMVLEDYKVSGILPSLTIAQAILESGWGTSELTIKANNLFGIKAFNDWKGKIYNINTKEYTSDGNIYNANANFKSYDSWKGGIEDHSVLLLGNRYVKVRAAKNYKDACSEVYKAGYATDPNYPSKLIKLIEDYKLYEYDKASIASSNSDKYFRVRLSWNNPKSQISACKDLLNAIQEVKKNNTYKVFDEEGNEIYPNYHLHK